MLQTPRRTRSSVLGKRSLQDRETSPTRTSEDQATDLDLLPTPEPTPKLKRARTIILEDGVGNKENIPPFRTQSLLEMSPSAGRSARSLKRATSFMDRTPSTPRRRTTSFIPATPSSALAGLSITTPPITPPSFAPLPTRAKALLRATCNGSKAIAGRAQEREHIHQFLSSFLNDDVKETGAATLYISGLPGTGKTALVHDVVDGLNVKDARVLVVNCMALNSMESLWDHLALNLCDLRPKACGRSKKVVGKDKVEQVLSMCGSKSIIVLDELDHVACSPAALSLLFALGRAHSRFVRIIGIANTHTLTSSISAVNSSADVQTVHFAAYSSAQLLEIVQLRLAPLSEDAVEAAALKKMLPLPALTLLSKKIATQTGDVRAIFEVLRGAIDLAVIAARDAGNDTVAAVSPAHVLAALKAYTPASSGSTTVAPAPVANATAPLTQSGNSELVSKARALSMQARLAMLAVVLASQRVDAGLAVGSSPTPSLKTPMKRMSSSPTTSVSVPIDSAQLHGYYTAILTRNETEAFTPVSRSEFADLLGMLETVGLVSTSFTATTASPVKGGRKPVARSLSFAGASKSKSGSLGARSQEIRLAEGVRVDELLRGLGILAQEETEDIREEEVRAVYKREHARIGREVKNRALQTSGPIFDEATED